MWKSDVFVTLILAAVIQDSFIHSYTTGMEYYLECYCVIMLCNTALWKGWKLRAISCSCFVMSKRTILGIVP